MTVDPQLEKILTYAAGAPPLHVLSVADARATFRRLTEERTPLAPDMPVSEIMIDAGESVLAARLYEPEGALENDLMVFFHGGGFVVGDLESHDPLCRRLAASAPIRVLSVAYRLGPEHPHPAAYLDAVAAVNWASDRLTSGGRLFVAGDSAGANIAAWTSVDLRTNGRSPIDGLLLIYPNVAFAHRTRSRDACGNGYMLSQRDLDYFSGHFLQGAEDRSLLDANFSGLPRTILVTAAFDPLCDEGRELVERMRHAGVIVKELHFPTLIHGFANMSHLSLAAEAAVQEISRTISVLRGPAI